MHNFPSNKKSMRFYNFDGIEEDVQDPKFFIDEEQLKEILETIKETLDYVDL